MLNGTQLGVNKKLLAPQQGVNNDLGKLVCFRTFFSTIAKRAGYPLSVDMMVTCMHRIVKIKSPTPWHFEHCNRFEFVWTRLKKKHHVSIITQYINGLLEVWS